VVQNYFYRKTLFLYVTGIIFLVVTLFFIPDEVEIIHILLASGGILFFISRIRMEWKNKKDVC
jgi:hypothetical protein